MSTKSATTMVDAVPEDVISQLKAILAEQYVLTDPAITKPYLLDETAPWVRPNPSKAIVVVKPGRTDEVSSIMKVAHQNAISVFPRGGGTGLCGGAVPTIPGIVIAMERMNHVEIDKENLLAICEAGVTLRDLSAAAEEAGLSFPPHPGDDSAQVGAMVATNAGGSRAIRHGVMRNAVRGLEVVLADGQTMKMSWKLQKDNTGYNLMNLFIGSEGTLGVITGAAIKLSPRSPFTMTMLIPYDDIYDAIGTVPDMLVSGMTPLAVEYVQRREISIVEKHLNQEWPARQGSVFLLVILDGMDQDEVFRMAERLSEISKKRKALDPIVAESTKEQERILNMRSNIYTALKSDSYDILDVSVPPPMMAELVQKINKISERFGIYIALYGHAGDGNLHPQLIFKEGIELSTYERAKEEIYAEATSMGGAITAEHGIGKIRSKFLHQYLSDRQLQLMSGIKRIFDPKGILNPEISFAS